MGFLSICTCKFFLQHLLRATTGRQFEKAVAGTADTPPFQAKKHFSEDARKRPFGNARFLKVSLAIFKRVKPSSGISSVEYWIVT